MIRQEKYFTDDAGTNTVAFSGTVDWNNSPALQTGSFTTETSFNALNLPISITHPDNSIIEYIYDKGGKLYQMQGEDQYIERITYNAKGQRKQIRYGNGTKACYQ